MPKDNNLRQQKMKNKFQEKPSERIYIEMQLSSGLKIGKMTVCSDLEEFEFKEEVIKKMVENSIQSCIDHIFIAGIKKIIEENEQR